MVMSRFSHEGVDYHIAVQRNESGLIKKVEIVVNKIATIIQNGVITVEGRRYLLTHFTLNTNIFKQQNITYILYCSN